MPTDPMKLLEEVEKRDIERGLRDDPVTIKVSEALAASRPKPKEEPAARAEAKK